jgi:pimeloyl-ACP methyl ester carboxylesterase
MGSRLHAALHGERRRLCAVLMIAEHHVVLLPGIVLPADLAYGDLVAALGDAARCAVKDLEVYATDEPPPEYSVDLEIDGVLRAGEEAGFDRFHLVGYSGGGAVALSFAARHPERLLSLVLMEPAWIGNDGWSPEEERAWSDLRELRELSFEQQMPRFVALQLAPGVEPPPPPPGPPPPWMDKRPAGIQALTRAFESHDLDLADMRSFDRPVLCWLGGKSNPDLFPAMARRLAAVLPDFAVVTDEHLHHFMPAHRFEPERLAETLLRFWEGARDTASTGPRSSAG